MKKLLPIGSVVLLKGAKKRVMVCGRFQRAVESQKRYDYAGCLYPEGVIDAKNMLLFNTEDIDRLFFIGFQDEEELKFHSIINKLEEKGVLSSEDEAK